MDPVLIVVAGFGFIVMLVLGTVAASLYKKCGPSEALIVSGMSDTPGGGPRVIIGGGTVVIPLLQQVETVSLGLISIDLKNTTPLTSKDNKGIYVNAVIEVCVEKEPSTILRAAGTFGGKSEKEMRSIIYDIVYDHLRQVISTMNGDVILAEIDNLTSAVLKQCGQDLASLGVQLRGFRVRDIREVRTNVSTDSASSNSYTALPAIATNTDHNNINNRNVIGAIAVVSNTISSDQPGEITYSLQSGSRSIQVAKTRMPGIVIETNTPVVIVEQDSNSVFVESWSPIHACMPASLDRS